jgi:hypothetical protein
LATRVRRRAQRHPFRRVESAQGADLNGDGDLLDKVRHDQLAPGGAMRNLMLSFVDYLHHRHEVAVRVAEADHGGQDLDGDGDALDRVLFAGSLVGPEFENPRLAAAFDYVLGSGTVVFVAHEASQGTDLNGDGDATDQLLQIALVDTGS